MLEQVYQQLQFPFCIQYSWCPVLVARHLHDKLAIVRQLVLQGQNAAPYISALILNEIARQPDARLGRVLS